jgi:hypothetical protein
VGRDWIRGTGLVGRDWWDGTGGTGLDSWDGTRVRESKASHRQQVQTHLVFTTKPELGLDLGRDTSRLNGVGRVTFLNT